MSDVDAVVVGAGNAGLTAAATLQRGGLRTLLVERHNVPGGCGTSFRRGRFEFEVALHQLSGLGHTDNPGPLRRALDSLGVTDQLEFVEEHELYRSLVPGGHDVVIPADWAGAVDTLEAAFPGNRDRLERFLELVRQVTFWQVAAMRGLPADRIDPVLFRTGLRTLGSVLDEHFTDPGLKHALGIYWTYLGQPPSALAFQDFALTLFAYLEFKPWHVRGGSQALSATILDAFVAAGGTVRFNTAVERIVTDTRGVVAVRLDDGTEVSTRSVVSNASLPATYGMLDEVPPAVSDDLARRRIGPSAFVVYLGLDAPASELGFTASTSFVSLDTDDDAMRASWATFDQPRGICITSYDVAPIGFSPPGASHVSLLTLQDGAVWDQVSPGDYHRAKFDLAQRLLDLGEHLAPGLRDVIEEADVATPRTMARYLGTPGGAIYGYQQDRADSWLFHDIERHPEVAGLHLAGSWTGMGGFEPTLEAGVRVARRVLRSTAA